MNRKFMSAILAAGIGFGVISSASASAECDFYYKQCVRAGWDIGLCLSAKEHCETGGASA